MSPSVKDADIVKEVSNIIQSHTSHFMLPSTCILFFRTFVLFTYFEVYLFVNV